MGELNSGRGAWPYTKAWMAQDSGTGLMAVCIIFIVLDTFFFALRLYSTRLHRASRGLDDWIIACAWVAHVGICVLGIVMVPTTGVARRHAYLEERELYNLVAMGKAFYALELLYLPSVALSKIAVALLYLRIFADRWLRVSTYILITITVLSSMAFFVAASLQCRPFTYIWDKSIPGTCFKQDVYYMSSGVPNIVIDVVMLALPLKTIFGLHISRMQKAGVLFVFLSGSMGMIGSAFRIAAFFNPNGDSIKLVSWTIAEPGMYFIAACSIKLRPVVIKFLEKTHLSTFSAKKETTGTSVRMGDLSPLSQGRINKDYVTPTEREAWKDHEEDKEEMRRASKHSINEQKERELV